MKQILYLVIFLGMATPAVAQVGLFEWFREKESAQFWPYPGQEKTTVYSCPPKTDHVGHLLSSDGKWCKGTTTLAPCGDHYDSKRNICVRCLPGTVFNGAFCS